MSDNGTPSGALVRETYGIAPSMVRRNGASDVYCVTGLPFRPHNVQATADTGPMVEGYPQGVRLAGANRRRHGLLLHGPRQRSRVCRDPFATSLDLTAPRWIAPASTEFRGSFAAA